MGVQDKVVIRLIPCCMNHTSMGDTMIAARSAENHSGSGSLRNAVTLITGGSRGIGLAIAQA